MVNVSPMTRVRRPTLPVLRTRGACLATHHLGDVADPLEAIRHFHPAGREYGEFSLYAAFPGVLAAARLRRQLGRHEGPLTSIRTCRRMSVVSLLLRPSRLSISCLDS